MGVYANSQESIFFKKKNQKNNVKFRKMLANLENFHCVSVARRARNTKKMCQAGNNYPRNSRRRVGL